MTDLLENLHEKLKTANSKTSFTQGEIEYLRLCIRQDYDRYIRYTPSTRG